MTSSTYIETQIRRFSRVMHIVSLLIAGLMPLAVVFALLMDEKVHPAWIYALSIIPALCLSMAFVTAARCFRAFSQAQWFTAAPSGLLRGFGRWLVLAGLAGLIVPNVIAALVATSSLSITFSGTPLLGIMLGLIIWILGAIWHQAYLLAEDNKAFV